MNAAVVENVKRYRKLMCLTQDEMAEVADVTRGAISAWEVGRTEPRMGNLQRLADYAGLSVSNLAEPNGMKYVTRGPDGKLHDDVAARMNSLRRKILDLDESAVDEYWEAERMMSQMRMISSDEAMVVNMYRSLNDAGKEMVVTMLAQFVKSGVYSTKEP